MTVRVTREAEPQIELYGAYTGELLGGALNTTARLTFTAADDYLIVVPKNDIRRPQLEDGPIPTSYIPTTTSTATRAGETLTIDTPPWPSGSPGSRGLAIAMDGLMTYADEGLSVTVNFSQWGSSSVNAIRVFLDTQVTLTGRVQFRQFASSVVDVVTTGNNYYSPGVNVPFSIASRHGDNFINGAVDGTALTADLTPTILPDLSATPIQIGSTFNGFIDTLRIWDVDIGDAGIAEASE